MKLWAFILAGTVLVSLAACGGAAKVTPTYTIGGTVSGLSGTGLVLHNGNDFLPVSANGAFTFPTPIPGGSPYSVTVSTQPSNPVQSCGVTNGTGIAGGNVTDVQVACTSLPITYTIGGTVSGLSGTGLVLRNGNDFLPVSANGAFALPTPISGGSSYFVAVFTQPSNPAQSCGVTNGIGIISGNVTNVQVTCTTNPTVHDWTWVSGSDSSDQPGSYGTQGKPSASNAPGARVYPCSWTDSSGNLWLFGGYGVDSTNAAHEGDLNDLWKYSEGQWTWVGGANLAEQAGTYGTQGTAAPGNVPGTRYEAACWADASGNFWLFGGLGIDSAGTRGQLNDLWKYSGGEWTWMSGSNMANQPGVAGEDHPGVYGTKGVAELANIPGARVSASSWADSSGNLWLFGGQGVDSTGTFGILNDLWKYSTGEWTWMSGSNLVNQFGVYGTQGTPAPGNVPGSRTGAATWVDLAGNLWLFGGDGNDLNGIRCLQTLVCQLNDMWEYSAGAWTWMGGSNVADEPGTYGTGGTPAPGNFPGARNGAVTWTDAAGNFWLFGGMGFDSTTGAYTVFGDLNDLWKYRGGEWTWMSGSMFAEQPGYYGTEGTAATGNVPGARMWAVGWIDPSGNLWMFGGMAPFTPLTPKFNDLWEYQP